MCIWFVRIRKALKLLLKGIKFKKKRAKELKKHNVLEGLVRYLLNNMLLINQISKAN